MNKICLILLAGISLPVFYTGCATDRQFEAVEQICAPGTSKAEAMDAVEDVLAQMHFNIEKADIDRGLIRTRPLPGAKFFEFWRSDNIGSSNLLAANLHSIRRTAELNITQQKDQFCITCDVQLQRLSVPEHRVTDSGKAYAMFSQSSPSMQTLKLYPEQKRQMAWLDLGKDTRLSTEILRGIEAKLKVKNKR